MKSFQETLNQSFAPLAAVLIMVGLYLAYLQSFLLFHTLAEFFSITIAFSIFILTWNARYYLQNGYLLFLGAGSLFMGGIDLLHTLAYRGMSIFPRQDADLPTQLWLAARYVQSLAFLAAPLFLRRRVNLIALLAGFGFLSTVLVLSIFRWEVFPAAYIDGQGLTPFKIYSEYAIILIFTLSIFLLSRYRSEFDPAVYRWLGIAIVLGIGTEFFFTLYNDVYGLFNLAGHYFKIVSFYLLYKAVIETGIVRPYTSIFRSYQQTQAALQETNAHLEETVQERTRSLEESRTLLERVIAQAADGIIIVDTQGKMTFVNDAARRITQIDHQNELTLRALEWGIVYDSDGHKIPNENWALARAVRGETITGDRYRVVRPDGSVYRLLISAAPLLRSDGSQYGAVATFADITRLAAAEEGLRQANLDLENRVAERTTDLERANRRLSVELEERKRAEAALSSSESRIRKLVESNLIGILYSTDRGKIIEANDALLAVIGYSHADLQTGRINWAAMTPPEYLPLDEQGIREARERGACTPYEKEYIRKDGSRVPILIGYAALDDEPGLFICFVIDLTRQKADEAAIQDYAARLERSNRELQDFAYVASHDLQEPLRKVIAFSDRLEHSLGQRLQPQERDYLERMQNAAARMRRMIDDLLSLSRVTTKAQPFAEVDLNQTAREVLTDLEYSIEQAGAAVTVEPLAVIEADPPQMRQLLQNLLANAIKFRRPDVSPVVRVYSRESEQPGSVELVVEDNGIGFDEQYAARIFQPFQRLHGRSEFEGSGIGLAVCQKIAARHGGSIRAQSRPGEGSSFIVTLPVSHKQKNDPA